ncbi:hypothetical protein H0H81_011427 [Sphagnurus paluster]|uniref:Uncharacterized protein n=1 Tax=Sphagnurus paluster TaxID=117069 RepID=A0A9P7GQR1_9AGAR|nr:hypothetical protein H0H81_011427 [Sphagnurus paluster]
MEEKILASAVIDGLQFGRMAREETLQEYEHNTLPANHPLSRHVRRVVARILGASNLGHIRGESTTLSEIPPMPYHGESGGEIPWDPDARIGAGASQHGPEREWDVIVVNDPKMINAQAVPGA